jgi:hypothetical protein
VLRRGIIIHLKQKRLSSRSSSLPAEAVAGLIVVVVMIISSAPLVFVLADKIQGTSGDDTLNGTPKADTINGLKVMT